MASSSSSLLDSSFFNHNATTTSTTTSLSFSTNTQSATSISFPNPRRRHSPLLIHLQHDVVSKIDSYLPCLCAAAAADDAETASVVDISADRTVKDRRKVVKFAWEKLLRWSRSWRSKAGTDVLYKTNKVVVLGGGSFGTAMAAHVAEKKGKIEVNMLVRDPLVCQSINERHLNLKYFPRHKLPENVIATTDPMAALSGADYCFHAVPVQFSTSFLEGVAAYVDPGLPFISLSKGLELSTLRMMSQIIPRALKNPRQPFIALSGPSFASELMNKLPTAMVAASKEKKLANAVQELLSSDHLRISTSRSGTELLQVLST